MFEQDSCPICDNKFLKNDIIVVCPVCGTPHHKDCYSKIGSCYHLNLHESGFSYTKNNSKSNETELICPKCGSKNSTDSPFCVNCGMILQNENKEFNANSFIKNPIPVPFPFLMNNLDFDNTDPNEVIDQYKVKYIKSFIKVNANYYLEKFRLLIIKQTKLSWNWGGFISPVIYFFYRKMWIMGLISILVMTVNSFPIILSTFLDNGIKIIGLPEYFSNPDTLQFFQNITTIVSFAFYFFCGLFANYLYKKKVFKSIRSAVKSAKTPDGTEDESTVLTILSKTGGASPTSVFTVMVVLFTLMTLFIFYFVE